MLHAIVAIAVLGSMCIVFVLLCLWVALEMGQGDEG